MTEAFICDGIRTPIGRYGGALSGVRTDDLGAVPLRALMLRHPALDWSALEEVYYGCVNQAGEDNRNVARMSAACRKQWRRRPSTACAARAWRRWPAHRAPSRPTSSGWRLPAALKA